MNVVTHDPELARRTRLRLWAEHLELTEDEIPTIRCSAIDELWKPISEEQLERRQAGRPLTHRLVAAAARLEALGAAARPAEGPARRRLSPGGEIAPASEMGCSAHYSRLLLGTHKAVRPPLS